MRGLFSIIIALLTLILGVIVGSQNQQLIKVNYLIAETQMPLSTLMSIMMAVGIFISLLICCQYLLRLKWRLNRLQRQQKKLIEPDNN